MMKMSSVVIAATAAEFKLLSLSLLFSNIFLALPENLRADSLPGPDATRGSSSYIDITNVKEEKGEEEEGEHNPGNTTTLFLQVNKAEEQLLKAKQQLLKSSKPRDYIPLRIMNDMSGKLWPEDLNTGIPMVPVRFLDHSLERTLRGAVIEVINEWIEHTCIEFYKANLDNANRVMEISVNEVDLDCGIVDDEIIVSPRCLDKHVLSSLIGLALGFEYEHLRKDRNDYVSINTGNLYNEDISTFFTPRNFDVYGVPYDYTSVMHPKATFGTATGDVTIQTKDIQYQGLLGSSKGKLSHRDKRFANLHYGCINKWLAKCGLHQDPCLNEGYIGSNCNCICRPGTHGSKCQDVKHDYYSEKLPSCSKLINEMQIISSPNFPDFIQQDTWCVYRIEAPADYKAKLKFKTFDIVSPEGGPFCYEAFLEVRARDLHLGTVYCNDMIRSGQEFVSEEGKIYLYLDVRNKLSQGFEIEIIFINKETGGPPPPPPPLTGSISTPSSPSSSYSTIYKSELLADLNSELESH